MPCYNEAPTVAEVIRDFRHVLPITTIYVYDNNSSDRSAELAADAGALGSGRSIVKRSYRALVTQAAQRVHRAQSFRSRGLVLMLAEQNNDG